MGRKEPGEEPTSRQADELTKKKKKPQTSCLLWTNAQVLHYIASTAQFQSEWSHSGSGRQITTALRTITAECF